MKILLFGASGQVGRALLCALPPAYQLVTTDIDIGDEVRLRDVLNSTQADIIINAAAYTNVDGAEHEPKQTFAVNSEAPRTMAEIAKRNDSLLIHYSTDYVFDGSGNTAWEETDTPSPLNIYGQSKLKADEYIGASGCRHIIFRTSWVYNKDDPHNFPAKILKLSHVKENLDVVSDQIGAPTSASFIAKATCHALETPHKTGLYHVCCSGQASWADFAETIMRTLNPQSNCQVTPILSVNYAQKAQRPLNSRLNCQKFAKAFGLNPPDWKTAFIAEFQ